MRFFHPPNGYNGVKSATRHKPYIMDTQTIPTTQTTVINAEPNSPKLDELRAKRLEFKKLARTFEPDSDDENAALLNAYKIEAEIKAEIANIRNAERAAEIQLKRSERIAIREQFEQALRDELDFFYMNKNPKTGTIPLEKIEILNGLTDERKNRAEKLDNELVARYSASTPAKKSVAADGTPANVSPSNGAASSDILTQHLANVAAGMTDSESRKNLESAGHKRSTVWHTVNNYNKAK
jgi:hypothetical protein